MLLLSAIWLALLTIELTRGLSPWLQTLSNFIWVLFVLQFVLEFVVAPSKGTYLRKRWLTAVSLALPALRLLRMVRFVELRESLEPCAGCDWRA